MDFLGDLSIGPLNVPVRYLAAASVIAAAIALARIPLRRRRTLRARVTDRLVNAAVLFVVAWKLSPALTNPAALVRDPFSILAAAPGLLGLAAGAAAASAYVAISLWRRAGLRRASRLPLLIVAGVAGIAVAGGLIAPRVAALAPLPPGPAAPPLRLPLLAGDQVSLDDLRGRVVVVNFWATWCPPCRAEAPDLAAFARSQGAGGAVLLGVDATSTESSEGAVRDFVEQHRLDYPQALDRTGEVTRAWDVRAWPTTVIVDPFGRVAARRTGAVDRGWLGREVSSALRRSAAAVPETAHAR